MNPNPPYQQAIRVCFVCPGRESRRAERDQEAALPGGRHYTRLRPTSFGTRLLSIRCKYTYIYIYIDIYIIKKLRYLEAATTLVCALLASVRAFYYMYIYVYAYICLYIYIHRGIHILIYIHIYTSIHLSIDLYMYFA